jgi:uncharacterized protein YvpB
MKKNNGIKVVFVLSLLIALAAGFIGAIAVAHSFEKNNTARETPSAEPVSPAPETALPAPLSSNSSVVSSHSPTLPPDPSSDTDGTEIRKTVRLDVPSYNQTALGYPLGCEIVSLAMMINFSVKMDINTLVDTIAAEMPRAENPNEGFRGDPASTNNGWTIFPKPLSALTEKYLGSAEDMTGCEAEDLKAKLNKDTPVEVWVNGLGWPVHALCLAGYDEQGFYYNDPATGEKDVFITYDAFDAIWSKPIYDRRLNISFPPNIALSY